MFVAISVEPPAASCTDRDISLVVAVCSSTAEAMVVCRSEICATIVEISSIAVDRGGGVALDRQHPAGDVLGRLRRLLRQLLDLVGHDGEALAGLAGPGRLDRRVQRQQVRLLGDAGDHLHHVADLGRGLAQLGDRRRRRRRGVHGLGRHRTGLGGVATRSPGSRHPSAPHRPPRSARCATPPPRREATTPDCALVSPADAEICADDADSSSDDAATASADAAISATVARHVRRGDVQRLGHLAQLVPAAHRQAHRQVAVGEPLEAAAHLADPADDARATRRRPRAGRAPGRGRSRCPPPGW